ncbi:NUDIX domain-containing protein [Kordiimonas sp. SCSIO 12603]|uniref:NUDIX hydrolase n=1 Tax=Kordiimonas sp. SCSIO 12603 TaxID=2829596 RepID=UPI0021041FCB|nr:NUDIX domain-containing protein [Kordiimonas sp. SCSIO 12603]UTW57793.1 NUDIX domain-containing protein [Kordiimonas sp. SCSIO 12603]
MYWQQIEESKTDLENLPVSAKVVVVSKDGKVLVLRKSSGIVDLPGGKVEKGENLFEAMERELKEEVGFKAKNFQFVTSWVKTNKSLGDRLVIVFEAHLKKKAKKMEVKLSDEHIWGKFLCPEGVDEIGDMPLGYGNAIGLCFNRFKVNQ